MQVGNTGAAGGGAQAGGFGLGGWRATGGKQAQGSGAGAGSLLMRRLGTGRTPVLNPTQRLLVLELTAKLGFREVTAGMLPEKALRQLAGKVRDHDAVSYWMHPDSQEFRVVVQDEDQRSRLNLYAWKGERWETLL
jgi:hypothetical protein